MHCNARRQIWRLASTAALAALIGGFGSVPPGAQESPRPPQYVSREVAADGRVTFRIHAPNAQAVRLSAGDLVGLTPASTER